MIKLTKAGSFNNPRTVIFFFLLLSTQIHKQAFSQQTPLSIKDAIKKVQDNLPQLATFRQQALATEQNIRLVKNTRVPDITAGYQVNLATVNNITGMSYPGFLVPISGPPSATNEFNFVPGSALGALIKWNPITFGQRTAALDKATAQFKQANAMYNEQLFQYQYQAINIYLEAVYYQQLLKSLQATINRNTSSLDQSLVLAKNGLRPGIDTAQFQAAIAQAEIDQLQAEKVYQQKMIELSRLTSLDDNFENIVLTDSLTTTPVPVTTDTTSAVDSNPHVQTLLAQRNTTAAGLKEIQKLWVPQLDIWGNLYGRGSGVNASGQVNKSDGFNLSRTNAGIGVQLSFPVLQYSKVNIQKKQMEFLLTADDAKLTQAQLDISKQTAGAMQQYRQDVKIAAKSPHLLKSATDVYSGLKLSYETGLIEYTRLAQAEYDLLKAEINDAGIKLQLWRSLLALSVAKGNLNLFTDQLK